MTQTSRQINHVIEPQYVIEGAGVRLRRAFGPHKSNPLDPFLLFDHFGFEKPIEGPVMGFPTHPHRGIETVTYMLDGYVRHRDSLGNLGVIGAGDVQWMTSGSGIMHEEMPRRGESGLINGFQLWVNLPAALKMSQPRYQEVTASSIPVIEAEGVRVRLVAGEYAGQRGPVSEIASAPLYMDVTVEPGAEFCITLPAEHTAVAYLFEGQGLFGMDEHGRGGELHEAYRLIIFSTGESLRMQAGASSPARFMLMAGAPFGEPIAPYGPFVMNTMDEIRLALEELRNGTFVKVGAIPG